MESKSPDPSVVAMAITTLMVRQVYHHRACRTSVAVGVVQGCGVGEAGAVRVVVDGPHAGLVSATVLPRNVDRVAGAAVSKPAGVTLVQAGLPGQVELPHSGQLSSQGMAVGRGCGQAQLLWHCGVEDFTWGEKEEKRSEEFSSVCYSARLRD